LKLYRETTQDETNSQKILEKLHKQRSTTAFSQSFNKNTYKDNMNTTT